MSDVAAWAVPSALGIVTLGLTYRAYRSQRAITRLEYVVITNTKLLPGRLANELKVSHQGWSVIEDPSLTIIRIVNTGNRAIPADDFETPLSVTLAGVKEIASATCTASRPSGLRPEPEIDANHVRIAPLLLNPDDMIELQVLSAGQASEVTVGGRITNLVDIVPRSDLPYPPGSGDEGEMLGFDRFMWYVLQPGLIWVRPLASP
jgi:hypothetical protein